MTGGHAMNLMTLDLSEVTDTLIGLVKSQWTTAPIWTQVGGSPPGPTFPLTFTGLAPDAARQQPGPQLGMYLYHVEPDNAREALFWQPQMVEAAAGEPTRYLPLALHLYYLLFAYSESNYSEEQEAMSVALRVFHANPIVRSGPGTAVPWELSLTMEHRSYDELSRLWQATTAPLRMSLVYRAAVVFIDSDPAPAPAPETKFRPTLAAGSLPLPLPSPGPDGQPVLFGTFRGGSYLGPAGAAVPFSQSPATVAPGQTVWLVGAHLGTGDVSGGVPASTYLLPPTGGAEVDVTTWADAADSSAAKVVLTLPAAVGPAPTGAPSPGVYQLRVGSGAPGSPGVTRSGSIPVSVAAFVSSAGGPVLTGPAPFTVSGTGFVPGMTEVFVGTSELTETTTAPGPGEVRIASSGTSFSFWPPAGPAGTVLPVRVRVNGIESDPALWVTL
jgi:hypothetical protein